MKTVLLAGFEPFGGEKVNPSELAVRALDGRVIAGHRVVGLVMPCVFRSSIGVLERAIRRTRPAVVICVGQAAGRAAIEIERVAINVDDAVSADNAGKQPIDRPIVRGGPTAYWSTLPIKAIRAALRRSKVAANVSQTAGTFVCNHVFYGLMHALRRSKGVRGGFVHVPLLPQQAKKGARSMSLAKQIRALEIVIRTAIRRRRDVRVAAGRVA